MTETELLTAKKKYDKLKENNRDLIILKEQFLAFAEDSRIQEYIAIKDWDYFESRVFELQQLSIIKKYLYLYEKYNGFKILTDNELIEEAFNKVINIKNQDNIYVYIESYKIDKKTKDASVRYDEEGDYFLYKNLETKENKLVFKHKLKEFKRKNKIIIFKNQHHKPIDIFYKYRIMYLRQMILDSPNKIILKKRLIKK